MTAYNALVRDLGMRKFVSRWVPHELSDRNKADRVELSKGLLTELRTGDIRDIITGDESWFYTTTILPMAAGLGRPPTSQHA